MGAAALGKEGIRGDGFCYPGVATDGTAGSDYCFAAQNCGVCVDCNIIFYSRVPFFVHELFFYAKGTKGYALVDFYVVADYAGFDITTPVPWSIKKLSPISAPGFMSIPVLPWACSLIMRGMTGTPDLQRKWAMR